MDSSPKPSAPNCNPSGPLAEPTTHNESYDDPRVKTHFLDKIGPKPAIEAKPRQALVLPVGTLTDDQFKVLCGICRLSLPSWA